MQLCGLLEIDFMVKGINLWARQMFGSKETPEIIILFIRKCFIHIVLIYYSPTH